MRNFLKFFACSCLQIGLAKSGQKRPNHSVPPTKKKTFLKKRFLFVFIFLKKTLKSRKRTKESLCFRKMDLLAVKILESSISEAAKLAFQIENGLIDAPRQNQQNLQQSRNAGYNAGSGGLMSGGIGSSSLPSSSIPVQFETRSMDATSVELFWQHPAGKRERYKIEYKDWIYSLVLLQNVVKTYKSKSHVN